VDLVAAAAGVETVYAPPAMHLLQDLHSQMPVLVRLTVTLPQKVHGYLACCWISIFLTCFLSDAPYRVPFASVSRAIRGVVPAGGVDWYALELDRPTALTLWLLTPMVDACDGFSPVMRIVDGAHDVTDVGAWDGRRWFEATSIVTRLAGSVRIEASPWGRFPHGGERSRSGPYAKPVLGPGTTLVAIEAPDDRGGAYTFAPGDLEIPGGGVDPRVAAWWRTCPASWEG